LITLAKFSACPSDIHYQRVTREIPSSTFQHSAHWDIHFWHSTPHLSRALATPQGTDVSTIASFWTFLLVITLRSFKDIWPLPKPNNVISVLLQHYYWTYAFSTLTGGDIANRSKTKPINYITSTEINFIAAVAAAKIMQYYHCSILAELGFAQTLPTPVYEDS
jgi:hypothetical protein